MPSYSSSLRKDFNRIFLQAIFPKDEKREKKRNSLSLISIVTSAKQRQNLESLLYKSDDHIVFLYLTLKLLRG